MTDDAALREVPLLMIAAWNRGSGADFAARFTDTADFVAFEGTHLRGRQQIEAFHQQLFDAVVKGSRLTGGEVRFVRFLAPDVAVMHARCGTVLPAAQKAAPSRDSMQLFVAVRRHGEWLLEAVLNARRLTLEQQALYDALASPSDDEQRELTAQTITRRWST
jgi:uncharacterized protein (TIGR02246 family)